MGILARLRLAKIRTMARPNSPDMPPKRAKKVRLGIITEDDRSFCRNMSFKLKSFVFFLKFWLACSSLRSKRSRTKNGERATKWKERGGGGERRKRLPSNPSILKNPFVGERDSWLVRHGYFDWQVYQVRLNDSRNAQCLWTCACASLSKDLFDFAWMVRIRFYSEDAIFWRVNIWWLCHLLHSAKAFKNLSAAVLIIGRTRRSNRWRLFVFPAKANLLTLAIFKQRIPISG